MFDIIIIGKGLIGSAAARYLSSMSDNVAVIGPDEPENWQTHDGVFASHYDQGRITRILDADPIWGRLAKDAMAAYGEIERLSGIRFHYACGGLRVSATDPMRIAEIAELGEELGADFGRIPHADLHAQLPYFGFPNDSAILWENGLAGYVNPRQMAAAQTEVAQQQGATVIRETATSLASNADGITITTDAGSHIQSKKVLLATGAYTNMLLPERPLALRRKRHMVLRAEVSEAEAQRLADMPTLIYQLPETSVGNSLYMLPPVPYPDGKTYIKLGCTPRWAEIIFDSWEEIVDWFHTDGDPEETEILKSVLHETLPDLQVEAYKTKPCILTYTEHNYPYIDQLDERLYVAAGGCGAAAKSSDAIGHLAALRVLDQPFPAAYDPATFKAVFASS